MEPKYTYRIDQYIYDELSFSDRKQFEKELSQNPGLAEEFKIQTTAKEYLRAKIELEEIKSDPSIHEAEEMAEIIVKRYSENPKSVKTVKTPFPKAQTRKIFQYISLAAVTILAVFLIRVLFTPKDLTERMYEAYYHPLESSNYTLRSGERELDLTLQKGVKQYFDGDYAASLANLSDLDLKYEDNPSVLFYSGLSYIGLERYTKAIEIFEPYITGQSLYLPEAKWYLSLCYLKTGQIENARVLLAELLVYEGIYKENAQDLLRKLKKTR
jgi:hypothetical protein